MLNIFLKFLGLGYTNQLVELLEDLKQNKDILRFFYSHNESVDSKSVQSEITQEKNFLTLELGGTGNKGVNENGAWFYVPVEGYLTLKYEFKNIKRMKTRNKYFQYGYRKIKDGYKTKIYLEEETIEIIHSKLPEVLENEIVSGKIEPILSKNS